MKAGTQSLLALTALLTPTLSAPTPLEGVSFPITDLLGSDLTIAEYTAKLEGQKVEERALSKRAYTSDTYNQLSGACRPITVIVSNVTVRITCETYTDFFRQHPVRSWYYTSWKCGRA
jgi:cutinase